MRRLIIPDSHGHYIDNRAAEAALKLVKDFNPKQIVLLGDHVDCSGKYSPFKNKTIGDDYTLESDIDAARKFIARIRQCATLAEIYYLEGNHENRVEGWAVSTLGKTAGREYLLRNDIPVRLRLADIGVKYYRRDGLINGASPGILFLEGCCFGHGYSSSRNATSDMLDDVGTSYVHGHTHRATTIYKRTALGKTIVGACPGTLAKLQPLYMHDSPSTWTHGVGIQFWERGQLHHFNVPIINGKFKLP